MANANTHDCLCRAAYFVQGQSMWEHGRSGHSNRKVTTRGCWERTCSRRPVHPEQVWGALCASKTVSTQHMPAITASCTLQRLVSLCTQSQSRQPAGVTMLAIHLGSKAVSTGHAPPQRVHLVQGVDITSGLRALDACQCNTCELVQRNKSLQHLMPFLRRARTSNCMTDSGSGLGDREHASCWLQPHHVQCPEFCIYQFCWRLL